MAPPASSIGRLVRGRQEILLLALLLAAYNNGVAFMPDRIRDVIYVPMNLLALCSLLLWAVP